MPVEMTHRRAPGRRQRTLACLGCATALSLGATAAVAAPIATTTRATSVTSTSARLNGMVSPAGTDSAPTFDYGKTPTYGSTATAPPIAGGSGAVPVSATVHGLRPATTYHFRLVVLQGSEPPVFSRGRDLSFTTLPAGAGKRKYGRASLLSHRLTVRHGVLAVPIKCSGDRGALCLGRISLSKRVKVGRGSKSVSCGGGTYRASGGRHHTLKSVLGGSCLSLVKASGPHGLHVTLSASFTSHQKRFSTGVTLVAK